MTVFATWIRQADYMMEKREEGEDGMENTMENLLHVWKYYTDAAESDS